MHYTDTCTSCSWLCVRKRRCGSLGPAPGHSYPPLHVLAYSLHTDDSAAEPPWFVCVYYCVLYMQNGAMGTGVLININQ